MIDTHTHLDDSRFDEDRAEVLARAREHGIVALIDVGIDVERSRRAIELAEAHSDVWAAVGLHPASPVADATHEIAEIERLAREHRDRIVAIGEFGLDFHWQDVPREEQYTRLEAQLDLASRLELPAIFHVRDALDEFLAVLERNERLPRGVFHCFAGGPSEVERAVDLGFHVSFCGNVTYPRAETLRRAACAVPLDRLLLETDCPYLPPQPVRGKRNEPSFVAHTRDALAEARGVTREELEEVTDRNARALFGLPELTGSAG